MKVLVFSHKEVWLSSNSPSGWATDGGFAFHMSAIASLFDEIEIVTPGVDSRTKGEIPFRDPKLTISPIDLPKDIAGWRRKLFVLIWSLKNRLAIRNKILEADLVHAPIPSDFGTIGMLMAWRLEKPLLIRHCGNWNQPNSLAEHFWKNFITKYTDNRNVVSFATGGGLKSPSIGNKKIEWIFSTSLLEKELKDLRTQVAMKTSIKNTQLITVARQVKKKGTATILEALAIMNNPKIRLTVVGEGADLDEFRKLADNLKLSSQVDFVGKLNNTEVLLKMLESDIFCFPTVASEGFPKVVLEALACGLPVITNPVSVLPQLIQETDSGIIMKTGTALELSSILDHLITNPTKLQGMSKQALIAAEKYSLERWADFISTRLNRCFDNDFTRKRVILK